MKGLYSGARALTCGLAVMLAAGGAYAQSPSGLDLSGVWRRVGAFERELKTADGETPPLLPEAASIYRQRQAALAKGDLAFDNASTICVSPGMPRLMNLPYPFQIIQGSNQILVLFEWNGRRRLIDMSGKPPSPPDLFYMGTAAGKVEGDTLVVETQGLTDVSLLDAAGMPHSDQLTLTERYRLVDGGKTLVDEITVTDPKTFARPWTTRVTYARQPPGTEIKEDVCRERVVKGGPAFE